MNPFSTRERWRGGLRIVAAMFFVAAGANHFRSAAFYEKIVPPIFPARKVLVEISGVAEIVGGIGLLIPRLRKIAGCGLIALLIAVFPANLFMAIAPQKIPEIHFPKWALWARLPLQLVLIAWVWFAASKDRLAHLPPAQR